METVGDLLCDASPELAAPFAEVPIPGALCFALGIRDSGPGGATVSLLDQPRGRTAMLVGPGVLRAGVVEDLREFATAAHVGVANTWGAKGVFNWDSPHHLGTCGLQARDFELLGFADLDLIWTVGLDPLESPPARFASGSKAKVVPIRPADLATFAPHVARSSNPIVLPPLFERLAAVAQPGYVDERVPRHPARAVMEIKQRMAPGAVVTAEPGLAGLWVARTFPTDAPGTVVVPSIAIPGIGAAVALVATRAGRAATVVTTEPVDETTRAILELAEQLDAPVSLEAWGDDVDLSLTQLLVDAAGPVVAWTP